MYQEFKCELFEKCDDGAIRTITGGGLISGDRNECVDFGIASVGKKVRAWKNEKEAQATCVGYKIWQRII